MQPSQNPKPFRHFAKHLFIAGKIFLERKQAKEDVENHLQRMRKSIIRMTLVYSDVDKLKEKINNLVDCERRYAKLFRAEDGETRELRMQLNYIEDELKKEREEKRLTIEENSQKMQQLTESLSNVKSKTNELLMERAKRHQRMKALESKISGKVDLHKYYHS